MTLWAVVLAGGASSRFGGDKLEARLDGRRLLERSVDGLPGGTHLVVVGPDRGPLDRGLLDRGWPVTYVCEDPPGGGPAAGMVAGLAAALADSADGDLFVVLPGDAPAAGEAANRLVRQLLTDPDVVAVVATDAANREQPLQLALRQVAVERLIFAAGPAGAAGWSARFLLRSLGDELRRAPLPERLHGDIDTAADLDSWPSRHADGSS
jgi:molybdopterin-guanine dinucleotide biosynthesis protein A